MCRPLCVVCAHTCSAVWEDIRHSPPLAHHLGLCQHSHWFGLLKFAGEGDNKIEDADHRSVVWFPWQPQNTVGEGRVGTRERE